METALLTSWLTDINQTDAELPRGGGSSCEATTYKSYRKHQLKSKVVANLQAILNLFKFFSTFPLN